MIENEDEDEAREKYSLTIISIIKSAFGRDIATKIEIHDVAGMLQVVGPFKINCNFAAVIWES